MSKPAQSEPQVPPRDSLSPLESGVDIIDGLLDREIETFTPGESYVLRKEDIDVLKRFQNRTVYTIGTQRSVHVYREQIIGMVCSVRSYLTFSSCDTADHEAVILSDAHRSRVDISARPLSHHTMGYIAFREGVLSHLQRYGHVQ